MKLPKSTKISRAGNLFLHPAKLIRRVNDLILEKKISNAAKAPFFMQSQMDINQESNWYAKEFVNQTGGYLIAGDSINRVVETLEPWDVVRRDMIILLLRSVLERNIDGDLAEFGVYKGQTARLIHHYIPERPLHLFDTFEGFDCNDMALEPESAVGGRKNVQFVDTSADEVVRNIGSKNNNVRIYPGHFPGTVPSDLRRQRFAFVHLDADLYEPIKAGLNFFCERVSKGGFLLVHDYNAWIGTRRAVDEFCRARNHVAIPMPDKSGSALLVNGI